MVEGFRWCPHCGRPHSLKDRLCSTTGQVLDVNAIVRVRKAPSLEQHPLIGRELDGKYRLLHLIGRGGIAEVFEAENVVLGRRVAVKVLLSPESRDNRMRLPREAHIAGSLNHPNICDVLDVGVAKDVGPYMVLERLFGETLATRLRRHRMSPSETIDAFTQMLSGLHAAHSRQILHRDVKPENVFLVERAGCPPLVKLVDFGFAKDLSEEVSANITRPNHACGTPSYMAPEQLRVEPLDARSDLFAVGIMLYEALSGRHPFRADTLAEVQVNILRAQPKPLRDLRPDVPAALENVASRALAKKRDERYRTALEMQMALASIGRAMRPSVTVPPPDERSSLSSLVQLTSSSDDGSVDDGFTSAMLYTAEHSALVSQSEHSATLVDQVIVPGDEPSTLVFARVPIRGSDCD